MRKELPIGQTIEVKIWKPCRNLVKQNVSPVIYKTELEFILIVFFQHQTITDRRRVSKDSSVSLILTQVPIVQVFQDFERLVFQEFKDAICLAAIHLKIQQEGYQGALHWGQIPPKYT